MFWTLLGHAQLCLNGLRSQESYVVSTTLLICKMMNFLWLIIDKTILCQIFVKMQEEERQLRAWGCQASNISLSHQGVRMVGTQTHY